MEMQQTSDHPAFCGAAWRKSTHSGQGPDCVEVATNLTGVVGVRDSVDPGGPALAVAPSAWRELTAKIKAGDLA